MGLGFRGQGVAVGEDYDFVDAEDGEGAGDVPRHGGAEVVGLCTGIVSVGDDIEGPEGIYLEIMLPGRATLTVQSRPLVGLKIAVGLEVSIAAVVFGVTFGEDLASAWRFRFYGQSVRDYSFQRVLIALTFAFVSPRPMILILFSGAPEILGR